MFLVFYIAIFYFAAPYFILCKSVHCA